MAALIIYGHWGLFGASFLAATLLPFSSEVVLGALLKQGLNPYSLIAAATVGNVLGAVVNYGLGALGSQWVLRRCWRMSDEDILRAEKRFERYGLFILLLAWMPVIGDPLTVAAGALRLNFAVFVVLVGLGKGLRYVITAWAVLSV